jgi:hypothetical protein
MSTSMTGTDDRNQQTREQRLGKIAKRMFQLCILRSRADKEMKVHPLLLSQVCRIGGHVIQRY